MGFLECASNWVGFLERSRTSRAADSCNMFIPDASHTIGFLEPARTFRACNAWYMHNNVRAAENVLRLVGRGVESSVPGAICYKTHAHSAHLQSTVRPPRSREHLVRDFILLAPCTVHFTVYESLSSGCRDPLMIAIYNAETCRGLVNVKKGEY
jgi:hypothetical protein